MSTAEVRFQTPTPQAGFKALNQFEESEVRASAPPELGDIAVANAMWRKAHPGWRDRKAQDLRPVYFILAPHSGLVKIGVAANPLRRLRALRTLSPEALELIALTTMGGRPSNFSCTRGFANFVITASGSMQHPSCWESSRRQRHER